ncbi:MAG: nicotinamide-nucleotide amidohydrolase family protein [Proteobacteria bacterium]|nr:nicotinamide-nucleotide amidohydrolase family protein [Pseudomonadota bacterium]
MHHEIITTGRELLEGHTINTNMAWLCRELSAMGMMVSRSTTADDTLSDISAVLQESLKRHPHVIIITGGLGPTADDITVEAVAKVLRRKMELSSERLKELKEYYGCAHLDSAQRSQAYVIEGAKLLFNSCGSASGFVVSDSSMIIVLPGPPKELHTMFQNSVKPLLCEYHKKHHHPSSYPSSYNRHSQEYLVCGLSESELASQLESFKHTDAHKNHLAHTHIGSYASLSTSGGIRLKLYSNTLTNFHPMLAALRCHLGDHIVASGSGNSLATAVVKALKESFQTLAVAESCSSGSLSAFLGEVASLSEVFMGGVVVYSLAAKEKLLGLDTNMLSQDQGVSSRTAALMATEVRKRLCSDWSLAITGWAGRKTDDNRDDNRKKTALCKENIGEVYIGISYSDHIRANMASKHITTLHDHNVCVISKHYPSHLQRKVIQRKAVLEGLFALFLLQKHSPLFLQSYPIEDLYLQ